MKYFFIIYLYLFIPLISYGYSLQGGISYTVDSARIEAFTNIPLSINISDYASYFSDHNYIANKKAINKKRRTLEIDI